MENNSNNKKVVDVRSTSIKSVRFKDHVISEIERRAMEENRNFSNMAETLIIQQLNLNNVK